MSNLTWYFTLLTMMNWHCGNVQPLSFFFQLEFPKHFIDQKTETVLSLRNQPLFTKAGCWCCISDQPASSPLPVCRPPTPPENMQRKYTDTNTHQNLHFYWSSLSGCLSLPPVPLTYLLKLSQILIITYTLKSNLNVTSHVLFSCTQIPGCVIECRKLNTTSVFKLHN